MPKQLAGPGPFPAPVPADLGEFAGWRQSWESAGVFTVALEFGADGSKGGEFEAFLRRVDEDLLLRVQKEVGRDRKPVVPSLCAPEHPEPPDEVLALYRKAARWLGPAVSPSEAAPHG